MKKYAGDLFLLLSCIMFFMINARSLAYGGEASIYEMDISGLKASEMLEKIPHIVENEVYEKIALDCLKAMEKYNRKDGVVLIGTYTFSTNEIQAVSDYLCYGGIIDPGMTLVARIEDNGDIKLEISMENEAAKKAISTFPEKYRKSMRKVQEICKQAELLKERDKVRFYHDWIKDTTIYGEKKGHQYTMYGVFHDKQAVCQGYSIAMHQLCRYSAIPSRIESFPEYAHYSNVVTLNDTEYYIDVTSDDESSSNKFYLVNRYTLLKLYQQDMPK